MRFLGSNSSVSEPTTIVGHDLQGQIRGQMTGITSNDGDYDLQGQIRCQMALARSR